MTTGAAVVARKGSQDLLVRDVPLAALEAFRTAARARGMTQGEFLAALVELHRAIRERGTHKRLLDELGLAEITT